MDQQPREASHIFSQSVKLKMWRVSLLIAFIVFIFFLIYVYLQKGVLTASLVNEAAAATAGVMIGLSFAISGFCYYFDFLDSKVAYRKYLGLVGFWLAFIYAMMLAFVNPKKYFYGFLDNFFTLDFVLGLTALEIFAFMAAISTNWAMRRMGIVNWRRGMRLGYLAYGLLIVRAVVVEGDQWSIWMESPHNLPPLRLVGSVFAFLVLVFRASMIVSQRFAKSK